MRYPKTSEYIDKYPDLKEDDYIYSLRDLGKTKHIFGEFTRVEDAIKAKAIKDYYEVIFSVRKPLSYIEYRCLISNEKDAKKYHAEIAKKYRQNQERMYLLKVKSTEGIIKDEEDNKESSD